MALDEEKNHSLFLAMAALVVMGGLVLIVLSLSRAGYLGSIWKLSPGSKPETTMPSISKNPVAPPTPPNALIPPTAKSLDNVISVKNQKVALAVTVDTAQIKASGFILIRRVDANGAPDMIVGQSKYLKAGTYENLKVGFYTGQYKPKVVAGDSFFITLVKDDNGNKTFDGIDFKSPALDVRGVELAVKFKTL